MSVPDQPTIFIYTGNGITTTFAYGCYLLDEDDLVVALNAVEQTTGYTVNGVGSQSGGAVIFDVAPADGVKVAIYRQVAVERLTDYQRNGDFRAQTVNKDFDRIWMALQDNLRDKLSSIRYPLAENQDGELPAPGTRALMLLGFDPNGHHTMYPFPTSLGAGDLRIDTFINSTLPNPDGLPTFTEGVTTQLTLSRPPGNPANLAVFMDGFRDWDWTVTGAVVTFNAPIPAGVTKVRAVTGTTLSTSIPPYQSVGPDQIQPHSVGDIQLAWGTTLGRVVDSIAALKALDTTIYKRAFGTGFYGVGDGGGGPYWFDATSADAEVPGVIVAPTVGAGRWKLIFNGVLTPEQCGAKGDGITLDSAAFQAAHDALPIGGEMYCRAKTYLAEGIRIRKPMTVRGTGPGSATAGVTGGTSETGGSRIKCQTNGVSVFVLVARQENYAFAQYGILGVNFKDICLEGKAIADRSFAAVSTDTSVNGGDYHIRHIHFDNVLVRFFQTGVNFTGINYLNVFNSCQFYWCDNGFWSARGASPDNGGQTRFFGCTFDQCGVCASLVEDGTAASFSFFGCTLSESNFGIRTISACALTVSGCEFESLSTGAGSGSGIYIKINGANPSSDAHKLIVGNKFLSSENDIWIDKTSSGSIDGAFNWPCLIDANTLLSAKALTITVPSGHQPMSSEAFVLGASNTGTDAGALAPSQISANFHGNYALKRRWTKRFTFNGSFVSGSTLWMLPLNLSVKAVRMYLTANASGPSQYLVGDQTLGSRYLNVSANSQALNTWVEFTPSPEVLITASLNNLRLVATGGMLGGAGVIEIDGYLT